MVFHLAATSTGTLPLQPKHQFQSGFELGTKYRAKLSMRTLKKKHSGHYIYTSDFERPFTYAVKFSI